MKAKVYTKGGDKGETSLVGGSRVSKGHLRLETYGTLDELNSVLGLLLARAVNNSASTTPISESVMERLKSTQDNLFNLGSHLACEQAALRAKLPGPNVGLVGELEMDMDLWEAELPELRNFIIPGGTELAALAHLARTVCRRAERQCVRARLECEVDDTVVIFLNRLSDWLFTLARKFNLLDEVPDSIWSPRTGK